MEKSASCSKSCRYETPPESGQPRRHPPSGEFRGYLGQPDISADLILAFPGSIADKFNGQLRALRRSFALMLDGFKLHLVRKCFLRRKDMLPCKLLSTIVMTASSSVRLRIITGIVSIPSALHAARRLCGDQLYPPPSFDAPVREQERRNRQCSSSARSFLHLHLERVSLKRQALSAESPRPLVSGYPHVLIVHEQLIVAGQSQINYLVSS